MELKEVIDKRKSHRDFYQNPVEDETIEKIKDFILNAKPLYKSIKTSSIIVSDDNVGGAFRWSAPHYIAIFSERKDGYLTNIGFIYQQVDLFLQSIGLASCWLGMGKLKMDDTLQELIDPNQGFVILIAFGNPKSELYREPSEFKRKSLNEISDRIDRSLEPARLAPSSVNSQPWYFVHDDNFYSVYCEELNFIKRKILGNLNRIDIGIALAHIYVSNKETFEFFVLENPIPIKGYYYAGSFRI